MRELDVLLVSPTKRNNRNTLVMSDVANGPSKSTAVLTLGLDDEAATQLPATGVLSSGTFRPTNYSVNTPDTFGFPAPIPTGNTPLNA